MTPATAVDRIWDTRCEIEGIREGKLKMKNGFCEYLELDRERCLVLQTKCLPFIRKKKQRCAFSDHYHWLTDLADDKSVANRIKLEVKPKACSNWQRFMQDNMPNGRKNMTARPLEDSIRNAARETLSDNNVRVKDNAGRLPILGKGSPIVDCYITKENTKGDMYPASIISIKTFLTQESVRETFGYAYLAKYLEGQRRYRVFMVCLNPIGELREMVDAFEPFLDGAYSLSGEPYIDDLLTELKEIYT